MALENKEVRRSDLFSKATVVQFFAEKTEMTLGAAEVETVSEMCIESLQLQELRHQLGDWLANRRAMLVTNEEMLEKATGRGGCCDQNIVAARIVLLKKDIEQLEGILNV